MFLLSVAIWLHTGPGRQSYVFATACCHFVRHLLQIRPVLDIPRSYHLLTFSHSLSTDPRGRINRVSLADMILIMLFNTHSASTQSAGWALREGTPRLFLEGEEEVHRKQGCKYEVGRGSGAHIPSILSGLED